MKAKIIYWRALHIISEAALVLWQLPQTLIGAILVALYFWPVHILTTPLNQKVIYTRRLRCGSAFSLGHIIVMSIYDYRHASKDALDLKVARHEWRGHGMQSRYLGVAYLFVIAIPSLVHAAIHGRARRCAGSPYNHFYTERWADAIAYKWHTYDARRIHS